MSRNGKLSHDPGPLPQCTTTCRHCGQGFKSIPAPILGEPPSARQIRFMQELAQHMLTKHPEESAREMLHPQAIYGLALCLQNFKTDDDGLLQQGELSRHEVHLRTMRFKLPDQSIDEKVSVLSLDPEKHAAVCSVIREIIEVYEERIGFPTQPIVNILV